MVMKIVADDQIPLVDELFEGANIVKKPGECIHREDLIDADILWVRTVTLVDSSLLAGTSVRFVGTATAGTDHLDISWLEQQGIGWGYAKGANAKAVAEYVLCIIAALHQSNRLTICGRAGIIGVGHVGKMVSQYLKYLGWAVLLNDPPRSAHDSSFYSTPLDQFCDLDLICVHCSLVKKGPYPSFHLLNDDFFKKQKPGTVLLNAARGGVIDTRVLLQQTHLQLCLDVWENEPNISVNLLRMAATASPHIAGYSVSAKKTASILLYQQAKSYFNLPDREDVEKLVDDQIDWRHWEQRALKIYNPFGETHKMRETLLAIEDPAAIAAGYLRLRKEYLWRGSL